MTHFFPLQFTRFTKELSFFFLLFLCLVWTPTSLMAQFRPDEQLGPLFKEVQLKGIFPDSKTFPDCIPVIAPEQIMEAYNREKSRPMFDLKGFVLRHFQLPPEPANNFTSDPSSTVTEHINKLWPILTRHPDEEHSSLLPLPHSYVVPGGRFREIYYWDSYFTMLGLQQSGEIQLIQDMVDNFTHLINTVGHIPNGNRSYYISRSQPPFYALMLRVLAEEKGEDVLKKYAPALRKEYEFWMDGASALTTDKPTHRRVVLMPNGSILNRFWDDSTTPRAEAYIEDVELAEHTKRNPEDVYRHLKAGAESGWDYSSRWLADGKNLSTIHTTDIIPVDLNALLYNMEMTLSEMAGLEGNKEEQRAYEKKAKARQMALRAYCWNKHEKFFFDFDFVKGAQTKTLSLAAVYPLFFKMAKRSRATAVAKRLASDFLKTGGLITTVNHTPQQWDAPNGWAPLQWISIQGLRNYGHTKLANLIAERWIRINTEVYQRSGKLTEKYNMESSASEGGGGEYPNQDGFGWTNGVLLKLLSTQPETIVKPIK